MVAVCAPSCADSENTREALKFEPMVKGTLALRLPAGMVTDGWTVMFTSLADSRTSVGVVVIRLWVTTSVPWVPMIGCTGIESWSAGPGTDGITWNEDANP